MIPGLDFPGRAGSFARCLADVADEPIETDALRAYWVDPRPFEIEQAERRQQFNAAMAAHDARQRARQEARWAAEGDV